MARHSRPAWQVGVLAVVLLTAVGGATGDGLPGRRASAQEPGDRSREYRMLQAKFKEVSLRCERLEKGIEAQHQLKEIMGFAPEISLELIEAAFKADMKAHGAGLPEEMQDYRSMLKYQGQVISDLKEQIEHLKAEIEARKRQLGNVDQSHDARSEALRTAAMKAQQDLAATRTAFNRDRQRLLADNEALNSRLVQSHKEMAAMAGKYTDEIARLQALLQQKAQPRQDVAPDPGGGPDPTARTWTDVTGRFRIRATLVKFADGKVSLRKLDGQVITLPLEQLSPEDRQFLRQPRE